MIIEPISWRFWHLKCHFFSIFMHLEILGLYSYVDSILRERDSDNMVPLYCISIVLIANEESYARNTYIELCLSQ